MIKGIDVSKHQGKINWDEVKSSDVQFVILRAGYGMYENQKDPTFEQNYEECKRVGLPVGVYWYTYATTKDEAIKEAEVCLKVLNGKLLELPVYYDQEYEPAIKALSKQTRTDLCIAFMEKIKTSGYKTGLYCSYDWIKNWVYEKQLSEYDKWIAQYSNTCSYSSSDLAIWQYSSKGKIAGISGNVDMDYMYRDIEAEKPTGKWRKSLGRWWYEEADGSYPKNSWKLLDDRWYWFDAEGYAVTGYYTINGRNFYFAEKSAFGEIKECQLIMTDKDGALI